MDSLKRNIEAKTVLLLIDVINDLDFPGNEEIIAGVPELARTLKTVKTACSRAGVPTIYLNDNYNNWHSNFNEQLEQCLCGKSKGKILAQKLTPTKADFFVLKPMHSGFYGTSLQILLSKMKAKKLILAGLAADICVMYTANDAYMRGFDLTIISDGVLAKTRQDTAMALHKMRTLLKAKILGADELIAQVSKKRQSS